MASDGGSGEESSGGGGGGGAGGVSLSGDNGDVGGASMAQRPASSRLRSSRGCHARNRNHNLPSPAPGGDNNNGAPRAGDSSSSSSLGGSQQRLSHAHHHHSTMPNRHDGAAAANPSGDTLQLQPPPISIQPAVSSLAYHGHHGNQSSHFSNHHHFNCVNQVAGSVGSSSLGLPSNNRADVSPHSHSSMDGEEEFRFVELSHPTHLLAGLNAMRLGRQFCDVVLCVDGQEFPAHRIVLSSLSAYFRAMFASEMAEKRQERVTLNGVEPAMINLIIQYAYTSEINITKANVQSLLSAANLLQVIPVRDACCRFMLRHMDESNVIGVHCFAEAHACNELVAKSKDYILDTFVDVCRQEEFLDLNESKLVEILSNDDIFMESEETVFLAAIRWLDHDPASRSANFDRVLEHVRLPLVSPYFLHDCVDKQAVVKENLKCRRLLDEAVSYHLLPDRRHEMRNHRTKPRKASGMVEVIILVGGEDDKVVLRSVESFDPSTHAWKTLSCLPFAVSKHGLVANGTNCMFLAGGEFPDGSASRSLWKFDPCYESWQELAPMNVPRSELGLALLDGSIYAVGGWEGSHRLDSVERFNQSTNSWSMIAGLKMAVTSPAVVALDGLLYVTGGAVLEDGDGIDLVQCFDPKANAWNELQPMLIPRSGSAACSLNGSLYIIGGWHASTENTNKVEKYDPVKDEWESVASMNERRYRPGVAVIDGSIYVCGGEEGWDRYHDTIERYDLDADRWTVVGEMPSSRSWLSCVALQIKKDHSAVCGEVGVKERSLSHGTSTSSGLRDNVGAGPV